MRETTGELAAGADGAAGDPDKTLVQPRFGVFEARTAQPVVPLAEARRAPVWRRGGGLPLLLILVSAVVGGLVSVLAYRTYQQRREQPARQEQQAQTPAEQASPESQPTPELASAPQPEAAQPSEPTPSADDEGAVEETLAAAAETAARAPRTTAVAADEKRDEATPSERTPRRTSTDARTERPRETERARRVETITGPVGVRVGRRERDDSELENEATDYETPAERRERRRARRQQRRNVDRVRAIFEGDPPR